MKMTGANPYATFNESIDIQNPDELEGQMSPNRNLSRIEDMGGPCQDYNFETHENDISYQHERTDRDFFDNDPYSGFGSDPISGVEMSD